MTLSALSSTSLSVNNTMAPTILFGTMMNTNIMAVTEYHEVSDNIGDKWQFMEVIDRTKQFAEELSKKVSNKKGQFPQELKSIDEIFQISLAYEQGFQTITQEATETIKKALVKKDGYFSRLFSKESWEEWLENRTALGKIISIYANNIKTSMNISRLARSLDQQTIRDANSEATILIKQLFQSNLTVQNHDQEDPNCLPGLAIGALGTFATQNPLPLELAGLNCLSGASAQRLSGAKLGGTTPVIQQPSQTQHGMSNDVVRRQLEMKIFEELNDNIPEHLKGLLQEIKEKSGWGDILTGGKIFLDIFLNTIHVTSPINIFKSKMMEMDNYYWINVAGPKYYTIFKDINTLCGSDLYDCSVHTVEQMKAKLSSYGYSQKEGSPVQFIEHLKIVGVCERC